MNKLLCSAVFLAIISLNVNVMADGKSRGGDEFRLTAERYDAKSEKYRAMGMNEISELYARQAEIKTNAAKLGDENRWDEIDWTEYHENESRINEKIGHMKKKH